MSEPGWVIVHGLPDARRALARGARLVLLSAPDAASYAGCGWWMELARQARAEAPGLVAGDWLDCGASSGRAMAALRIGQRGLILDPAAPGFPAVAAIADAQGAALRKARPPALDMAARDADRRLAAWLGCA
jgi:hypothetical protein